MIFSSRGSANERAGPSSQARSRAHGELSIRRQCQMLGVARSGVYRKPRPANDNDLEAMRRIDALFSARPFFGARGIARTLHSARLSLPGRRHRLGEPGGAVLAAVQHDGRFVLRGGARGRAGPVRQYRRSSIPTRAANSPARPSPGRCSRLECAFRWTGADAGWTMCSSNASGALAEIRGGLSERLRRRPRGESRHRRMLRFLQRATPSSGARLSRRWPSGARARHREPMDMWTTLAR